MFQDNITFGFILHTNRLLRTNEYLLHLSDGRPKGAQDLVEGGRRIHSCLGLLFVKEVVAAKIDRVTLAFFELFYNLATIARKLLKDGLVGGIFLL